MVFHSDSDAAQIEGTDKVDAVKLENGQRLPSDLVLFGKARIAAANLLGHAGNWDEFKGNPDRPPFIGLFSKNGVIAAAVACDKERAMAMLAERMKQPQPVDEAWWLIRDVD